MEVFHEQVHRHQLPPLEEICQFFAKPLRGKMIQQIVSKKLCLHRRTIALKHLSLSLHRAFCSFLVPELFFLILAHPVYKM